ncbi:hypothetical protein PR001_g17403 [Phytophthora rubi]|uniref:Uncharacterized protein n=1 Tax=Phytophthora rubi TaxID=129364 RepID=A0A6A3KE65_9STRA|nr:hypothetical protein PR001_g17403 [Phytophthora rubi]
MATSAYQSWLKKREFKAPRPPSSPSSAPPAASAPPPSKESAPDAAKLQQEQRVPSPVKSGSSRAVSAMERTRVAVKHVVRPSAVGKRPRSCLSDLEEAAGREDGAKVAARLKEVKVAVTKVAQYKVAAREDAAPVVRKRLWSWNTSEEDAETTKKRRRSGQEQVMRETALKLASASKVLRLSAAKRELERAAWSGRVDTDAKVAAKFTAEVKTAGIVGLQKEREGVKRKREIPVVEQSDESNDTTTKRLRFDTEGQESDGGGKGGGLPPKSPMQKKPKKMRTAMLDESQYWMAVDRFSHLT